MLVLLQRAPRLGQTLAVPLLPGALGDEGQARGAEALAFAREHYRVQSHQPSQLLAQLLGRYLLEGVEMPLDMDKWVRELEERMRQELLASLPSPAMPTLEEHWPAELERRRSDYEHSPGDAVPWEQLKRDE